MHGRWMRPSAFVTNPLKFCSRSKLVICACMVEPFIINKYRHEAYTSIGCCTIRPTSHPTLCTHLSRMPRIIEEPSNPFVSANSSSPRSQDCTVSLPNIPPCWFTTSSTLPTHAFHSSNKRGNKVGTSNVCVSVGCTMT